MLSATEEERNLHPPSARHENLANKQSLGIILPTFCEAENIESLIREIKDTNQDVLILVIDDSSPDGTAGRVKKLQKEYSNILLLERPEKLGLGTAITDGFKAI